MVMLYKLIKTEVFNVVVLNDCYKKSNSISMSWKLYCRMSILLNCFFESKISKDF